MVRDWRVRKDDQLTIETVIVEIHKGIHLSYLNLIIWLPNGDWAGLLECSCDISFKNIHNKINLKVYTDKDFHKYLVVSKLYAKRAIIYHCCKTINIVSITVNRQRKSWKSY